MPSSFCCIKSTKNEKIKEYVKLSKNKKYRDKLQKFAIEGVRLLKEAIKHKAVVCLLFLTEDCYEKIGSSVLSKECYLNKNQVYIITEKVADYMADVETPQGVFAVVKKQNSLRKENINCDDNILALYEVKDPGNMGTLIRTAYSFGFFKIIIFGCCDVYSSKSVRSSMGAVFGVSFYYSQDFIAFLKYAKTKNINIFSTALSSYSKPASYLKNKQGILILGSEALGLPHSVLEKSDYNIKINMTEKAESLNVAIAGSILMYEMKNV